MNNGAQEDKSGRKGTGQKATVAHRVILPRSVALR